MRRSEEGILLRKKQEQWAKEKEERAHDSWFPFGSPGGGNPNKRHVARDYEAAVKSPTPYARPAAENVPPPQDPSSSGRQQPHHPSDTVALRDTVATSRSVGGGTTAEENGNAAVAYSGAGSSLPYSMHGVVPYPMMYATTTTTGGGGGGGMEYMQQFHYAPMHHAYGYGSAGGGVADGAPSAAVYPPYAAPTHYPPHHMIPVHVLPAGTIPIPVPPPPQNTMTSSFTEGGRWVSEWTNPHHHHHHMGSSGGTTIEEMPEDTVANTTVATDRSGHTTTTMTAVCSLQQQQDCYAPPTFPAAAQPRDVPHAYVSPFVAAAGGGSAQTTASEERSEDEYDVYKAQILERQRLEAEQEERERREEERIERVRKEKEERRKMQEEKREEEERKREEERQRSAQAVLEAMERARKEAELLKKLRLHRHTLEAEGGDAAIDGVDRRRVEEMKREVDAFERQKRMEAEEIARNAPPKEKEKEKKRGVSLSRPGSGISAHYEASARASSDESSRSRSGAPSAPSAASPASPFRRAASLAPASAAARRSQQAAAAAAASPPQQRQPLAASTPQKQQQSPFERDAKARFSLRGTPSPQGVVSRYAHLNQQQSPVPSSRVSTASTLTPSAGGGRSPSVGRPPIAPPRQRMMSGTPSMPSRDSPLSRTFHAGDQRQRQKMKENARSSGYGIGGDWLYSYSPSASRSATPDRLGWSSNGRTDATPDVQQQPRRGRDEERRRTGYREESFEDGGSSPASNETFITSPTVTATSRVDDPLIRYSVPSSREDEYGISPAHGYGRERPSAPREEYGSRPAHDYGMRARSSSLRPTSRTEELDEYGRRSHIPVPLPRTRFPAPISPATSVTNPLFSPISTRARKMRISSSKDTPTYRRENSMESSVTSNDSGASSGSEGGTGEGIRKITAKERVIPAINVDQSAEETDEAPIKMFTPRFSSRPSTPSGDRVNGGVKHYADRVREMGTAATADRLREPLTPTVQPRASTLEPSSSLSASLRNLRASINNLHLAGSDLYSSSSSSEAGGRGATAPPAAGGTTSLGASPLLAPADSPGLTRFHSRTSQYRSFNTKRGTEKQQQLLDRLVSLRSRLQDTQSYKDRPLSRQGSTLSIAGAGVSRLAASH